MIEVLKKTFPPFFMLHSYFPCVLMICGERCKIKKKLCSRKRAVYVFFRIKDLNDTPHIEVEL